MLENFIYALKYNPKMAIDGHIDRMGGSISVSTFQTIDTKKIIADLEMLREANYEDKITNIKNLGTPMMFLHGKQDGFFYLSHAINQLSNCNLIINKEEGHTLGNLGLVWCRDQILKFIRLRSVIAEIWAEQFM